MADGCDDEHQEERPGEPHRRDPSHHPGPEVCPDCGSDGQRRCRPAVDRAVDRKGNERRSGDRRNRRNGRGVCSVLVEAEPHHQPGNDDDAPADAEQTAGEAGDDADACRSEVHCHGTSIRRRTP